MKKAKSKPLTQTKIHILLLILTSSVLTALCLSFAIGVYEWRIFVGYFRYPLIFLLNWIPVFVVQILFLSVLNRQWSSFLVNAVVFLGAAIGNFFKLKLRDEPFRFSDIGSIGAAMNVAGNYGLTVSKRILAAVALVLLIALLLWRFCRGGMKTGHRLLTAILAVISCFPLWKFVYSDSDLYRQTAYHNLILITWDSNEYYIANGFMYPFLHSITDSRDIPPSGYSEAEAAEILNGYEDELIPEDRKVNVLAIQLESFTDLEAMGVSGISPDVYEPLRRLETESICGTLVPNIIGGGTIDTERCFIGGTYGMQSYHSDCFSYARLLSSQGYDTSFGHPNRAYFYNRQSVAYYLGFDHAYFNDNYYQAVTGGEWRCDSTFLPNVFQQFEQDIAGDQPVFSFRVSLQGHSPYNTEGYDEDGHFWANTAASEETLYMVNNYLSLIAETQRYLLAGIDTIRDCSEPCVVLIYGDHNPRFDGETAYQDLGLSFDMSTEKGVLDYYSTPWLLWANDAAKQTLGRDFVGDGQVISPGYLMNVLFHELGWGRCAFMQFTDSVLERLSVVTTNGYYMENGEFTTEPSPEGEVLLHDYESVQYYLHHLPVQ